MISYFVEFKSSGVIGLISAVLSGFYTFGIGRILNFAMQYTQNSDLRLRIASSSGLLGLVNEIITSRNRSVGPRMSILTTILLLTLTGKSISIIVTSGIKASMGLKHDAPVSFAVNSTILQTLNLTTRGNSSTMLTSLYNWHQKSDVQGTIFQVLSDSTPGRIFDVTNSLIGSVTPKSPVIPGQFSLMRQLYVYQGGNGATCDPTSPDCSLMSMRTNLSQYANLGYVFDAPLRVRFNGGWLTEIQPAFATANLYHSAFLAEKPITKISATFDGETGKTGYVAVTNASFQAELTTSEDLVKAAKGLIGSSNPIYPSIFVALEAGALTPPLVAFLATPKVTFVHNAATPKSDNTSIIHCVGYEGNKFHTDHSNGARNMISCREFRLSVWTNTPRNPEDFSDQMSSEIFSVYNAMARTMTELDVDVENLGVESLDTVAKEMEILSKEIADRLYPLKSKVSGIVTPYRYVEGIRFELWSLIFIGAMTTIIMVIVVMDMIMNDAVAKADLATLIENTTETHEMMAPKKGGQKEIDWAKSEYPPWALVKNGNLYQVTLRRDRIELESREFQKLNQAFP